MSFWKKKQDDVKNEGGGTAASTGWSVDSASSVDRKSTEKRVPEKEIAQVSNAKVSPQKGIVQSAASPAAGRVEGIEQRFGAVRSALGPGTNIQGKLSFDVPVRLDGELGGEIFSTQAVIVGPSAKITATIEATALIILGDVKGDVVASERVEILNKGVLTGDIKVPALVLEDGGRFNGTVTMPKEPALKKAASA